MADVLIVEDDPTLGLALRTNFELEGHRAVLASTLAAARRALANRIDCVVLDLGLPDGDGLDLCVELREAGNTVPILILTARGTLDSRVSGLRGGADDYLTKPFDIPELLARVEALLRRGGWAPRPSRLKIGHLVVDPRAHEAWRDGDAVALTALEMKLLTYFLDHAGEAVTREELLENVWELSGDVMTRTVDVFVGRLRRLIEPEGSRPKHLVSVRGVGYRLVLEPREA